MDNLIKEYTDIKDVTHRIEHIIAPDKDNTVREQIVEAIFYALTKQGKRISA